jgi:hypothetical protein
MDIADIDLWRFAAPLPVDRQDKFLEAAQNALSRLHCLGPGSAYRVLAELQREFFVPIADEYGGGAHRNRRPSKLTSAAPLA